MSNKLLVVIVGPTGVGKTDLAIQLAAHYHTEIISADSRQIYKELNIGVGRPSLAQLDAVPHHLVGHTTIFGHYTAGHFGDDALNILEKLFSLHDIVFLTGGTGLYVKAVIEGFDKMPDIPIEINERWTTFWKENGTEALVANLQKLDPDYLEIVDKSNPIRLIRALAVSEATGKPYSSFRKGKQTERPFQILPIVLDLPREELFKRIDQRVLNMITSGWEEEARSLHPHKHLKALQTVGYKELFEYFEGILTLPQAIAAIQQSTRRYAKRQITWWRHQGSWHSFSPDHDKSIVDIIDFHFNARGKGQGARSKDEP